MSRVQIPASRRVYEAREQLHDSVRWTAQRGRLLASLRIALLCIAALIGGLFVVAIKDAIFNLPVTARLALLFAMLLGSLIACAVLALRPWLNQRFSRAAGEQIDRAAHAKPQPVTVGLSLNPLMDDDSLALSLLKRAESRAADVAKSIKPKQAYPLGRLHGPGVWLALALGLWLMLAIIVPSQVFAMFARVAMPWGDTPPFSLTQFDPQWTPNPPDAGDDVTLTVEPTGLMPELVAWIRLDTNGKEAERFEMASDGQGGFSHLIKRVETPIDFRLEAHGRNTRTYTITPTPRPPADIDPADDSEGNASNDPNGTATFDPDKIARRDLDTHRDWPGIKADLQKLLDQLAEAQALAQRIDPADAQSLQALADKLGELTDAANQIAGELAAVQGELPAEASALLDALADALSNMQSAALPAPPNATDNATDSGEPTPSQWLDQAAKATKADQQRIGQGVGPSDLLSESGTASGQPDQGPDFRDPRSQGTYDETNISGEDGPLPDAAMQQVPPSYRALVSKYFERLSEDQPWPMP